MLAKLSQYQRFPTATAYMKCVRAKNDYDVGQVKKSRTTESHLLKPQVYP